MAITLILSAVLASQASSLATDTAEGRSDAAYEQLVAGENEDAIAHLEQALERAPGDPAILINLGTAYAREGRLEEARTAFREAAASETRYRVELADGSWEDSRQVARLALTSLDQTAFASK